MAVDDSGERGGQVGLRINGVELARFDQRGDGRPILGPGIVPGEECIPPIQPHPPFILPMSAMKSRFTIAGIPISARRLAFVASNIG